VFFNAIKPSTNIFWKHWIFLQSVVVKQVLDQDSQFSSRLLNIDSFWSTLHM